MPVSAPDGDVQPAQGGEDHPVGECAASDEGATITRSLQNSTDRSVDIALAEFNALRAEIVAHQNTQAALVGVGLTAIGVLISVALKEGAGESAELLLAVPPISLAVVLLRTAYNNHVAALGNYIRADLWPFLTERVGVAALPSWEARVSKDPDQGDNGHRLRRLGALIPTVLVYGAGTGLFCASSVVSMLLVRTPHTALIVVGWLCAVGTIAVPASLFIATRVMGAQPISP